MARLIAPQARLRQWPQTGSLLSLALLGGVVFVVFYPLAMVVFGAFRDVAPGQPGPMTLDGWRQALTDLSNLRAFYNTILLALPRTLLGLGLATAFAWIIARTNTPGKLAWEGILAFLFFLPDLPWIQAWMLLGAPRVGLLNQWFSALLPWDITFINVYSYAGIIILSAARTAPVLFLFVYPAFKAMDATLEESSRMSGANGLTTILRINLPLLKPALLATFILAFIRSMESFEMELLLGTPAKIFVFTTRVYDLIYGTYVSYYGPAMALSMILLLLTFSLVIVYWKMLGGRIYTTVTGRGYQARPLDLGKWRWATFAFLLAFVLVFGALPFVILAMNSFMKVSGFMRFDMLTTTHWRSVFQASGVMRSIKNTIILGVAAATLGAVLCSLISYIVTRSKWGGRKVLDLAAWSPLTVPGLVLALGFLWAFVYLPIYGTIWVLIMAFIARTLPGGSRFFTSTMVQISPELEECSRIHGAGWTRTFARILVPLLKPAFFSAWILIFVIAVRTLDTALLLYGPNSRVLAVDIYQWISYGRVEGAAALGLIQTAIVVAAWVPLRILGSNRQTAVR